MKVFECISFNLNKHIIHQAFAGESYCMDLDISPCREILKPGSNSRR